MSLGVEGEGTANDRFAHTSNIDISPGLSPSSTAVIYRLLIDAYYLSLCSHERAVDPYLPWYGGGRRVGSSWGVGPPGFVQVARRQDGRRPRGGLASANHDREFLHNVGLGHGKYIFSHVLPQSRMSNVACTISLVTFSFSRIFSRSNGFG